jgi:hypothetical protein
MLAGKATVYLEDSTYTNADSHTAFRESIGDSTSIRCLSTCMMCIYIIEKKSGLTLKHANFNKDEMLLLSSIKFLFNFKHIKSSIQPNIEGVNKGAQVPYICLSEQSKSRNQNDNT